MPLEKINKIIGIYRDFTDNPGDLLFIFVNLMEILRQNCFIFGGGQRGFDKKKKINHGGTEDTKDVKPVASSQWPVIYYQLSV